MTRHWFILQVGTNREEKVRRSLVARLQANDLARLVPSLLVVSEKRTEIKGGQRRTVEQKVYPGYVMLEVETDEDGSIPSEVWHLVRETPGHIKFVGTPDQPNKPQPMSAVEVAKLRRQVEALSRPEVAITVDFEKGERVRVKEGSFMGFDGTVEEVHPEKGIVRVTIIVFGRPTPIDFEFWKIEKADI
jgi:transcription termination/antitermination protein NusG